MPAEADPFVTMKAGDVIQRHMDAQGGAAAPDAAAGAGAAAGDKGDAGAGQGGAAGEGSGEGGQPRGEHGHFAAGEGTGKGAAAAAEGAGDKAAAGESGDGKGKAADAGASTAADAVDFVLPYVYKGEQRTTDFKKLLTDPKGREELRGRWQMSEDYPRQRELATEAQTRAPGLLETLEREDVVTKDALTGNFVWTGRGAKSARGAGDAGAGAEGAAGAKAADTPDPADERIAKLLEKAASADGLTVPEVAELTDLKAERKVRTEFAKRDDDARRREAENNARRGVQEQQQFAENLFTEGERRLDSAIDKVKNAFLDPVTDRIDEQAVEDLRTVCKAELRRTGDLNQLLSRVAERARAAQTRVTAFTERLKKAQARDAAPPVPGGGNTAGPASTKKSGIDLDAPSGLDGIAEAAKRWDNATRR